MGDKKEYQLFGAVAAPGTGIMDWGRLVWIANRATSGIEGTMGYVEINPGANNPPHRHHTCSETMFIIEGTIRHVVGEDSVELTAGDALVVPPGMLHNATNIGSGVARMIVAYDTGERDFEVAE